MSFYAIVNAYIKTLLFLIYYFLNKIYKHVHYPKHKDILLLNFH